MPEGYNDRGRDPRPRSSGAGRGVAVHGGARGGDERALPAVSDVGPMQGRLYAGARRRADTRDRHARARCGGVAGVLALDVAELSLPTVTGGLGGAGAAAPA